MARYSFDLKGNINLGKTHILGAQSHIAGASGQCYIEFQMIAKAPRSKQTLDTAAANITRSRDV